MAGHLPWRAGLPLPAGPRAAQLLPLCAGLWYGELAVAAGAPFRLTATAPLSPSAPLWLVGVGLLCVPISCRASPLQEPADFVAPLLPHLPVHVIFQGRRWGEAALSWLLLLPRTSEWTTFSKKSKSKYVTARKRANDLRLPMEVRPVLPAESLHGGGEGGGAWERDVMRSSWVSSGIALRCSSKSPSP